MTITSLIPSQVAQNSETTKVSASSKADVMALSTDDKTAFADLLAGEKQTHSGKSHETKNAHKSRLAQQKTTQTVMTPLLAEMSPPLVTTPPPATVIQAKSVTTDSLDPERPSNTLTALPSEKIVPSSQQHGALPTTQSELPTKGLPFAPISHHVHTSEKALPVESTLAPVKASVLPRYLPLESTTATSIKNHPLADKPSVNSSLMPSSPPASPMTTHSPSHSITIQAPLASLQWQKEISQQIIFHRQGKHTVHLKLHPEELGAVKISMTLQKDQAELMMTSAHGQVRAALEAAIPHLRQALAENGIQLGQSQVGQESGSASQQFQPPTQQAMTANSSLLATDKPITDHSVSSTVKPQGRGTTVNVIA